ncbi:MAG: stage 0 sporulation family protein [Clostridia bacterium]|nr:stage 0 sporulation family protein [Clostridia bacterium]MBR7159753.1 stage 0 sporulation family protein [Clostridia bacterium]
MSIVIGVKFRTSPKTYYFGPNDETFLEGDVVIVETARGVEHGKVVIANKDVPDSDIVQPLKQVLRKATDKDKAQIEKNEKLRLEALKIASPKIAETNPEMKLVDVEYTFDQTKIIFYFTAEGRVDFRELVRILAQQFKKRIEMRQIDERDDYKLKGGLATCGRPCCCSLYASDCDKVSIKMAKTQGLSLNPTKISGLCGKLMCCLRYENEYYADVNKVMPKQGATIVVDGEQGVVVSRDMLRRTFTLRVEKSDGVSNKVVNLDEYLNTNTVELDHSIGDQD